MDLGQTCTDILLGNAIKIALSVRYVPNGWMDKGQTSPDISLETVKTLLDFGDLDLVFKVTRG